MKIYSYSYIILFILLIGACKSVKEKEQMETKIIGDGITDASGSIASALYQNTSVSLESGKTYLLKNKLDLKTGQTLNLNGATLLFDLTNGGVGIDILEQSNITIKNGTIERRVKKGETLSKKSFRSNSYKASVSGIYCNTANNTFQNLTLKGWMSGIRLTNYSSVSKTYKGSNVNNKIENCKFYGNHFGIIVKGQKGAVLSGIEGDYGARIAGDNDSPPHLIYLSGVKSSGDINENITINNVICRNSHAYFDGFGSCVKLSSVKNSTLTNLYSNNCDGGLTIGAAENLTIEGVKLENMSKACIKTGKTANNIRIKSLEVTQTAFSKNAIAINGSNFLLEDVNIKYGTDKCSKVYYTLSVRGNNNTVKNISFENCEKGCKYILLGKSSNNNEIINLKRLDGNIVNKKILMEDRGNKNIY